MDITIQDRPETTRRIKDNHHNIRRIFVSVELANTSVASVVCFLVDIRTCLAQETFATPALEHAVLHFYVLSIVDAVTARLHMFAQLTGPDVRARWIETLVAPRACQNPAYGSLRLAATACPVSTTGTGEAILYDAIRAYRSAHPRPIADITAATPVISAISPVIHTGDGLARQRTC